MHHASRALLSNVVFQALLARKYSNANSVSWVIVLLLPATSVPTRSRGTLASSSSSRILLETAARTPNKAQCFKLSDSLKVHLHIRALRLEKSILSPLALNPH